MCEHDAPRSSETELYKRTRNYEITFQGPGTRQAGFNDFDARL